MQKSVNLLASLTRRGLPQTQEAPKRSNAQVNTSFLFGSNSQNPTPLSSFNPSTLTATLLRSASTNFGWELAKQAFGVIQ